MNYVIILQLVLEFFRFINHESVSHEDRTKMVGVLTNARQMSVATGSTSLIERIKQAILGD